MALIKSVVVNGVTAEYHRIGTFRWEPVRSELQVAIELHVNATAAAANPGALLFEFARFRLTGTKFLQYMSRDVLADAAADDGNDILALIYEAIKDVALNNVDGSGNIIDSQAYIKSDFGYDFYADAVDG